MIKINLERIDENGLVNLNELKLENDVYVVSNKLINDLLKIDTVVIKGREINKAIFIKNILNFLRDIDRDVIELKYGIRIIQKPYFVKYFNSMYYVKYKEWLKRLGIMSVIPYEDNKTFYVAPISSNETRDAKACQYRFYNSYLQDELCLVILNNYQGKKLRLTTKVPKKFSNAVKSTAIDYGKAFIAELRYCSANKASKNILRTRLNRLFALNGPRFISKGGKVDRISHSLSNVSKVSREFLSVEGQYYNNIDVVNCQPLLLCYYCLQNNQPIDDEYIADCEDGTIYERFFGVTGDFMRSEYKNGIWKTSFERKDFFEVEDEEIRKAIRKEIKIELYNSIYFDFKMNPISDRFSSLYPQTYSTLANCDKKRKMKEVDKKGSSVSLACELQNIEASIFNDIVPSNSDYYYTLYDSIYFTELSDVGYLIKELKCKFGKYGIRPQLTLNGKNIELGTEIQ